MKNKKKIVKRGKSKVTSHIMGQGATDNLIAFKVDDGMNEFLDGLENKSEFLRKAVLEAASKERWVTCPTCSGRGEIKAIKKLKG